jgi:hypothetical protein
MNRTRRRLIAGIGTTGLASLAGCSALDFALGNESLRFEADAAVVAEGAVSETGYSEANRRSSTVDRTFEVAGESRTVEVTNQVVEYDRSLSVLGQTFRWALFAVLSTPKVEVLGKPFNPVADMDTDALAEMIQERYDRIGNVERDSTRPVDVLGETVDVVRYRAEGRFTAADIRVDMTLHVTPAIAAGGDFVVCLAAHPRLIDDTDDINTLLGGVAHTGSGSTSDSESTDSSSNSTSDSESDSDSETSSNNSSGSDLLSV